MTKCKDKIKSIRDAITAMRSPIAITCSINPFGERADFERGKLKAFDDVLVLINKQINDNEADE